MWVKSFSVFGHRLISVIFGPSSYPRDLSFWKQVPIELPIVVAPPRAHTTSSSSHCITSWYQHINILHSLCPSRRSCADTRRSLPPLETIWRHLTHVWIVGFELFWTHCLFVHRILLSYLSVSWTLHKSWISEDTLFKTSWRLLPLQKYPFRDGAENALAVEPMV